MDRHAQALGEAKRACEALGSQMDPDRLAPRGRHYADLTKALSALEGSCRQIAHMRSDMRWVRLQMIYARIVRSKQRKFVGQHWRWFKELTAVFELGHRHLADLRDQKTGKLGPILAARPSEFLVLPEPRPLMLPPQPQLVTPTHYAPPGTVH